jgi:hypothetical protein
MFCHHMCIFFNKTVTLCQLLLRIETIRSISTFNLQMPWTLTSFKGPVFSTRYFCKDPNILTKSVNCGQRKPLRLPDRARIYFVWLRDHHHRTSKNNNTQGKELCIAFHSSSLWSECRHCSDQFSVFFRFLWYLVWGPSLQ